MSGKAFRLLATGATAACLAISSLNGSRVVDHRAIDNQLTVHEWGTFTSVAGPDGQAVSWLPLTGSTDLPRFVEHYREEGFKCGQSGTVRMETPVLYFYTPHEKTVSVNVSFLKGFITEWYPHASAVEPAVVRPGKLADGAIRWDHVRLLPGLVPAFGAEDSGDRYYAARATASTPVRVRRGAATRMRSFCFIAAYRRR